MLHDETGYPGWLQWQESLSQHFNLNIPMMPGYGESARLDWAMSMRDMTGWYLEALDDLDVGQVSVIGFSLGGWLAAELATMDPSRFKKLVLVSAAGVRPPVGEILDMFLVTMPVFLEASVHDKDQVAEFSTVNPAEPTADQVFDWEDIREVACMLGWRPYMHNPTLPQLLHRLEASAHAAGVGSRRRGHPAERGTALQRVDSRIKTGCARQLRPQAGAREAG